MKVKKLLSVLLPAAALTLGLSGCSDYDNEFTDKGILFQESFKGLFGDIDPNQNWNMAAQYSDLCKNRSSQSSSEKTTTRSATPNYHGMNSNVDGWVLPSTDGVEWSVNIGRLTVITEDELAKVEEIFPEGDNRSRTYASTNSYYVSDGKPLTIRMVHSQTSSYDVLGVYDIEHPERRLPILHSAGNSSNQSEIQAGGRPYGYIYEVNIPKGAKYGFYIEIQNHGDFNHTHFSENALNAENGSVGSNGECPNQVIALSSDGTFVGYEDAHGGEVDFNDIVLHVNPSLVDRLVELDTWIVACEDLGDVDDIDFNDIVLDVTKDNTNFDITALAAGGTLASDVYYTSGHNLGEIHYLLNGTTGENGQLPVLNANNDYPSKGTKNTFQVEATYDVAAGLSNGHIYAITNQAPKTGSSSERSEILTMNSISGQAPKMLVLPGNWEWPKERVSIKTAYPDFEKWVADASVTTWVTNKNKNYVVKRNQEAPSSDGNSGEGTGTAPVVNENYGTLVPYSSQGVASDWKGIFINPSYFWGAESKAVVTIVNKSTQQVVTGNVTYGHVSNGYNTAISTINGQKNSITITNGNENLDNDDYLTSIQTYGMYLAYTSYISSAADWGNYEVYVKLDGDITEPSDPVTPEPDPEEEPEQPTNSWPSNNQYTFTYTGENIQTSGWGSEVTITPDETLLSLLPDATSAILTAEGTATSVYPNSSCFTETSLSNGNLTLTLNITDFKSQKKVIIGTNNGYINNIKITISK